MHHAVESEQWGRGWLHEIEPRQIAANAVPTDENISKAFDSATVVVWLPDLSSIGAVPARDESGAYDLPVRTLEGAMNPQSERRAGSREYQDALTPEFLVLLARCGGQIRESDRAALVESSAARCPSAGARTVGARNAAFSHHD